VLPPLRHTPARWSRSQAGSDRKGPRTPEAPPAANRSGGAGRTSPVLPLAEASSGEPELKPAPPGNSPEAPKPALCGEKERDPGSQPGSSVAAAEVPSAEREPKPAPPGKSPEAPKPAFGGENRQGPERPPGKRPDSPYPAYDSGVRKGHAPAATVPRAAGPMQDNPLSVKPGGKLWLAAEAPMLPCEGWPDREAQA